MSRVKEYSAARRKLEQATATLIHRAKAYGGTDNGSGYTSDLLEAAREYGRAMNRLERVRRK